MPHVQNHYDIVYVARTPQQASAPTLSVLGPIFGDVKWVVDVYNPDTIEVTASVSSLDDDLKLRLRDLLSNPTEIWVYRQGTLVTAGFIVGGTVQDDEITISAVGLSAYLKYMFIIADKTFTGIDQALIAKELVDDWQALDYGDFGIDTSAITSHGVTRTINYKGNEFDNIHDVLIDLGAADNGFDLWVHSDTRELTLDNPTRGSDLSASVFLERGITSPNIKFSVAPGVVASESFGAAKNENGLVITSTQGNVTTRQNFGRAGIADTYEDGEQTFLDDQTKSALDVRTSPLFHPGPGLVPVDGAQVEDFTAGDQVTYAYNAGIGTQSGVYRVIKKVVNVERGKETMEVEFE